jgi:exosortase
MPENLRAERQRWTTWHLAIAGILLLLTFYVTSDSWADSFRMAWRDEETSYVLAAPLVIAWLAWVRRGRVRYCEPGGSLVGLAIMALGWFLWSYGYWHRVMTLWRGGPVVLLAGCAVCIFGSRALYHFLPAFAAMIFLIPVTPYRRYHLAMPLQTVTAQLTQRVCDLLGIYVDRSGNLLMINGVDVAVAEACNGMRMVLTLFLVCYVLAFTAPLKPYGRAMILIAAPLVAIVANVLRLVPTVWVFGNASGQAAHTFHRISGWVMLLVAFLVLRGALGLLRWARLRVVHYALATSS